MNTTTMFSSASNEWATPAYVFDPLNAEFGFTLDVCATKENAKVSNFFSPEDNGLTQDWHGVCWMNPPYGREIGKWVAKAHREAGKGLKVVALLPARTDTKWWHQYIMGVAREVRFVEGRIYFGGAKNAAPFPSAIVYWYGRLLFTPTYYTGVRYFRPMHNTEVLR